MSDKPENQGHDFNSADDELSQPPKPEQIWPPPGPKKRPQPPASSKPPADEGEPIELDWDDGVEKLDDVIEEIRHLNGETEAMKAAAELEAADAALDDTPVMSREAAATAPRAGTQVSVRVRPKSEAEMAQLWSNVFFSAEQTPPKAVIVTPARRGDGATQIATGLALIGAEANRDVRIALVDFNLRHPDVADLLGISAEPGVTDVLTGRATLDRAMQTISTEGGGTIHVLSAGAPVEQPLGLLKSRQVKAMLTRLKDRYDHVIIDVSSPSTFPDPQIIGSMVDGALLVVRAGQTPRETVSEVKKRLDIAGVNCLGLVLNQRNDPIPALVYRMT
ncbi:MAG: hypothetical protein DCC65_16760 [Planctomycetota bacterium]|nr:MAG: hypothetical protein DCC65_16760 [Planctomycetota bacterium]